MYDTATVAVATRDRRCTVGSIATVALVIVTVVFTALITVPCATFHTVLTPSVTLYGIVIVSVAVTFATRLTVERVVLVATVTP